MIGFIAANLCLSFHKWQSVRPNPQIPQQEIIVGQVKGSLDSGLALDERISQRLGRKALLGHASVPLDLLHTLHIDGDSSLKIEA